MTGRRAAITAATMSVMALLGAAVLTLGLWRFGQLSARHRLEADIQTYRNRLIQTANVVREESDLERRIGNSPALVHVPDNPRAAAELQDSIRQIAASCGGDVRSAQVLPFRRKGAFDVISIQAEIVVPAAKLPALLYAVETHTPYIFVASADIVAPMKFDKSSIFDVEWVLRAYRWHTS